jgi:hypothetical protein
VTTIRDSEQPVWASILWWAWEANSVVYLNCRFMNENPIKNDSLPSSSAFPWAGQSPLVHSWWGAIAALMLAQAYSFIFLQGLIHLTAIEPVAFVLFLVIPLVQAGLVRAMNQYLKSHDWRTALRFLHSPVETLKFCAAILSTAIYLYLLTGHRPILGDPALYVKTGFWGNLGFQLFNLAMSFVMIWLWKIAPKNEAPGLAIGETDPQAGGASSLINAIIGMFIGILFIALSCYIKELFYVLGVIGYGMITISLCQLLSARLKNG